jgi:hypothetical protein
MSSNEGSRDLRVGVIRFAECRTMPWKNGGGSTTELAVFPEGAGLDAFDWRISMARVEADGPFSAFPGIDRTLAIMEGDGLSLSVGDHAARLVTLHGSPLPFPADQPAAARLLGQPILDLNVMSRRGVWRHAVSVVDVSDGAALGSTGPLTILVARDAPVELRLSDNVFALGLFDALRIDADRQWTATATGRGALLQVELSRA